MKPRRSPLWIRFLSSVGAGPALAGLVQMLILLDSRLASFFLLPANIVRGIVGSVLDWNDGRIYHDSIGHTLLFWSLMVFGGFGWFLTMGVIWKRCPHRWIPLLRWSVILVPWMGVAPAFPTIWMRLSFDFGKPLGLSTILALLAGSASCCYLAGDLLRRERWVHAAGMTLAPPILMFLFSVAAAGWWYRPLFAYVALASSFGVSVMIALRRDSV